MIKRLALCFVLLSIFTSATYSWGFWSHKQINRMAVYILPSDMLSFFKSQQDYISEHAVDPDKRRYSSEGEAPRHYIDVDHYGEYPFEDLPRNWYDAIEQYSEDTLQAWGIAPWHILHLMDRLTQAMSDLEEGKILRYTVDLGHYIGDIHVPLHTTENYNGQLTGQKGIHGFWESRLPELYAEDYDFLVGQAEFIKDPEKWVWDIVLQSHLALDSVLAFEKMLSDSMSEDVKFNYEERGEQTVKVYSEVFSKAYHDKLNGMVERRMRASIFNVGSAWYSCWVMAGKPDFTQMMPETSMKVKKVKSEKKKRIKKVRSHQDKGFETVE